MRNNGLREDADVGMGVEPEVARAQPRKECSSEDHRGSPGLGVRKPANRALVRCRLQQCP